LFSLIVLTSIKSAVATAQAVSAQIPLLRPRVLGGEIVLDEAGETPGFSDEEAGPFG